MKKLLAILLAVLMLTAIVACTKTKEPATEDPTTNEPVVEEPVVEEPVTEDPVVEEPVTEDPVTEPATGNYAALALDLKNKTGVTITGLYLYESGAEDKGNSFCPANWPDKDADGDNYEFFAYIVRPEGVVMDMYVEFEDGTNATWEGLTIANNDKLSLKDGVDPAGWEQEAVDDAEDLAKMAEVVAAGKTSDNYYPGYAILGLEIKNKTGLAITEFYFYEQGGDHTMYNNMVSYLIDEGGNAITAWQPGKGGLYVFDFFIRPEAEFYEIYLVYEDGSTLTITDIDLNTPNGDGFLSNEISMKDAVDPDLTEVSYDDGDPEPLQLIIDAINEGIPADGWYPVY